MCRDIDVRSGNREGIGRFMWVFGCIYVQGVFVRGVEFCMMTCTSCSAVGMEYGVHVTGKRFDADESSDVAWNRLGGSGCCEGCMTCDLEYVMARGCGGESGELGCPVGLKDFRDGVMDA